MITEEEYKKWKPLIDEYEHEIFMQERYDLEDDEDYWEDTEDEDDPLQSMFDDCTCGAYVLGKNGGIVHVSDCYCS